MRECGSETLREIGFDIREDRREYGPVPENRDNKGQDNMSTIRVNIPGHGEYTTTTEGLDRAIAKYLPASPGMLRAEAEERAGHKFEGVYEVSAFLVILADFDTEEN